MRDNRIRWMALGLTVASLFRAAPPSALAQDLSPRLKLVGEWPTCSPVRADDVAPHGDYAYFVGAQGFRVLNVSDPTNPYPEVACHPEWPGNQVLVQGDYAFVCYWWEDPPYTPHLRIINVADPLHPWEAGSLDLGTHLTALDSSLTLAGLTEDGYAILLRNEPSGVELLVVDVSSPFTPWLAFEGVVTPLGTYLIGSRPGCVALVGDRLYAALDESVFVIDLSNRDFPQLIGEYRDSEWDFYWITVSGDTVYVYVEPNFFGFGDRTRQLLAIDMTDPAQPELVGGIEVESYAAVHADPQGSYLYGLRGGGNAFEVLDVTDPAQPTVACRVEGWGFRTLKVSGGIGHATEGWSGSEVALLDLRNPSEPKLLSIYDDWIGNVSDLAVRGQFAYLACGDGGMRIMDVSDPATPKEVGHYTGAERVSQVELSEDEGVLLATVGKCGAESRLHMLGLKDPIHPQLLGECEVVCSPTRSLVLSGDLALLRQVIGIRPGSPPRVYDVSDPRDPRLLFDSEPLFNPRSVAVPADGYLYGYSTLEEESFLTVVDLSDPGNPRTVASVATEPCFSRADGLARNGYLFLPCGDQGLVIMDISDPTNPRAVSQHPVGGNLALSGDYLSVAGGTSLEVLDVSDPANPRQVAKTMDHNAHHYAGYQDIAMQGNRIFAACHVDGFQIFDLLFCELKAARKDGQLELSWEGFLGAALQHTRDLAQPAWEYVPNSWSTERMLLPLSEQKEFYRLVQF